MTYILQTQTANMKKIILLGDENICVFICTFQTIKYFLLGTFKFSLCVGGPLVRGLIRFRFCTKPANNGGVNQPPSSMLHVLYLGFLFRKLIKFDLSPTLNTCYPHQSWSYYHFTYFEYKNRLKSIWNNFIKSKLLIFIHLIGNVGIEEMYDINFLLTVTIMIMFK